MCSFVPQQAHASCAGRERLDVGNVAAIGVPHERLRPLTRLSEPLDSLISFWIVVGRPWLMLEAPCIGGDSFNVDGGAMRVLARETSTWKPKLWSTATVSLTVHRSAPITA